MSLEKKEAGFLADITSKLKDGSKILVLLRGCTGSGKWTLARKLRNVVSDTCVGVSVQWCSGESLDDFKEAVSYMSELTDLLIIIRRNLTMGEMIPYALEAMVRKYKILVVEPFTDWRYDKYQLATKARIATSMSELELKKFVCDVTEMDLISQAVQCVWQSQEVPKNQQDRHGQKENINSSFENPHEPDNFNCLSTTTSEKSRTCLEALIKNSELIKTNDETRECVDEKKVRTIGSCTPEKQCSDSYLSGHLRSSIPAQSSQIDLFDPNNIFELTFPCELVHRLVSKFGLPSNCKLPSSEITLRLDIDEADKLHTLIIEELRLKRVPDVQSKLDGISYSAAVKLGNLFHEFNGKLSRNTVEAIFRRTEFNEAKTRILLQRRLQVNGKEKVVERADDHFEDEVKSILPVSTKTSEESLKLKNEYLKRATIAYINNQGPIAAFYASVAREHDEDMKSRQAVEEHAIVQCYIRKASESNNIDLHNVKLCLARKIMSEVLADRKKKLMLYADISNKIHIITGVGNHSNGHVGLIRKATLSYLHKERMTYTERPMGKFTVRFPLGRKTNGLQKASSNAECNP
ncbi:hypothetical protein ACOME3_010800 [Neoechinorhynchus agilis]